MTKVNNHVPEHDEHLLGTNGVRSRYHALLNTPYSHPFSGTGYLIGIEKAARYLIGAPEKGPDLHRLQAPHRVPTNAPDRDLDQQQRTFQAVMDDPKIMFLSHILRYGQSPSFPQSTTDLHYSVYKNTAFGPTPDAPRRQEIYERGWKELIDLEALILNDIEKAKGKPFTHLMVMTMGWNNDQFEALERYNAIYQHSTRWAQEQGRDFNPMVICFTWPSVWGGTSMLDLANRAAHLGSYATKSMDADEIGFGIANHVVNAMLPLIEAKTGLRSVLVGHSMGARVLTRAYYSADTLVNAVDRTTPGPIVIGLQAAFSMNRFRTGAQLIPVVRDLTTGEGAPYQDHAGPGGAIALTWADGDRANPWARFATGARHVGGKPGYNMLNKHQELAQKFEQFTIGDTVALPHVCEKVRDNKKVLYVDASSIVASHGDIRNPDVGELVWRLIEGLGG